MKVWGHKGIVWKYHWYMTTIVWDINFWNSENLWSKKFLLRERSSEVIKSLFVFYLGFFLHFLKTLLKSVLLIMYWSLGTLRRFNILRLLTHDVEPSHDVEQSHDVEPSHDEEPWHDVEFMFIHKSIKTSFVRIFASSQ